MSPFHDTALARRALVGLASALALTHVSCSGAFRLHQRDLVVERRAGYNNAFFYRHNDSYRRSAAIHFSHAKQHDVLQLTALAEADEQDADFYNQCLAFLENPPWTEPGMMYYGPHTGQLVWELYWAIDWTHHHHEQTYDVLSERSIAWKKKAEVTDETVDWYLHRASIGRSPAPLDVTMRRAAVMMKPYFGAFRNQYPRSAKFFFAAHWWHPAIYEAIMIAGNDDEQNASVEATDALMPAVIADPPLRMLLSREMMPRYSRMSPESANIFDNLHMLHGIAYDILAFERWTPAEKRAELLRVIEAMSEQPGDRELARLFALPYPDVDPRVYEPWMRTYEGTMNAIMERMLAEMWPMMGPGDQSKPPEEALAILRRKLTPGMQPGEHEGSLMEALRARYSRMRPMGEGAQAGRASTKMVQIMLQGWRSEVASLSPVAPLPMEVEPTLPPVVIR